MKRFAGLSLYQKISSVNISALILLGALLGLLVWNALDTAMSQQFEKRGVELSTRLASLCSEHILFNDPFALHEVANEVKNSSADIRYVLVTDHKGKILAHTFAEGIPQGLLDVNARFDSASTSIEPIDSDEGMLLDIKVPIENGKIGYARVGISEKTIRSLIQQKMESILLITLLVSLAAALLTARLTATITKPIKHLAGIAGEIADGHLESRVEVKSDDEIGQLSQAFNHMAESLTVINQERDALLTALQEKERMRDILFSKLITAQEDERKRISRELHDETGQVLTSLIVSMRLLADDTTNEDTQRTIKAIRDVIASVLDDVRNLAVELRPPVLDELGLAAAMAKYVQTYQQRYGIDTTFSTNLSENDEESLDSQVALALYRIMQECLTNIAKHAEAKHATVHMDDRGSSVTLVIADDGKGIQKEALRRAKEENRIGMYGMQERAELIGGTFSMISAGSGTTITITIPNQGQPRRY